MGTLLRRGDKINQADERGMTPLMFAAQRSLKTTELLLSEQWKVAIDQSDLKGETALHYAVKAGNIKTVETLLNTDADPNSKNKEMKTPLFYAEDAETAHLLLLNGADPFIKDKKGKTPRYYAERSDNKELIKRLKRGEALFSSDKQ
jgi:ankyrin repeat protein